MLASSPVVLRRSSQCSLHVAAFTVSMSPLSLLLCCMLSLAAAFTSPAAALPLSRVAARSVAPVCMATSKAMRVNERNRAYNKKYKSEMRTTIKRVRGADA